MTAHDLYAYTMLGFALLGMVITISWCWANAIERTSGGAHRVTLAQARALRRNRADLRSVRFNRRRV